MLQSLNGEGLLNMTPQSETKKKKIDGFDYITIWTLLWQELKKETKSSNKLEKSLQYVWDYLGLLSCKFKESLQTNKKIKTNTRTE